MTINLYYITIKMESCLFIITLLVVILVLNLFFLYIPFQQTVSFVDNSFDTTTTRVSELADNIVALIGKICSNPKYSYVCQDIPI